MSFWSAGVFLLLPLLAGVNGDCVQGFQEVGRGLPVTVITPPEPVVWEEIYDMCLKEDGDSILLRLHTILSEEDEKKCGRTIVPVYISKSDGESVRVADKLATEDDLKFRDESYPRLAEGSGVLNLSSGLWHIASVNDTYNCGICITIPLTDIDDTRGISMDGGFGNFDRHRITLRSLDVYPVPDIISAVERERLLEEIKKVVALFPKGVISPEKSMIFRTDPVANGYQMVFLFYFGALSSDNEESQWQPALEAANGNDILRKYNMKIEDVEKCPEDETKTADSNSTTWPVSPGGTQRSRYDDSTGLFTRRVCEFNFTEDRNLWSKSTFWEFAWGPCTLEEQVASEIHYYEYLDTNQKKLLQQLAKSPVNKTTLDSLGYAINNELFKPGNTIRKTLTKEIGAILLQYPFRQGDHSHIVSNIYVQLVAIDLEMDDPNDGISMEYKDSPNYNFQCPKSPIKVHLTSRMQTDNQDSERFSVKLSETLISVSKQLAFVVVWEVYEKYTKDFQIGPDVPRYSVVNIALHLKENVGTLSLDADKYYVDVAVKPSASAKDKDAVGSFVWNNNIDNWIASGCNNFKADRSNLTVFRCKAKYFLQDGDMLTAKYGIFEMSASLSNDLVSMASKVIPNSLFTI